MDHCDIWSQEASQNPGQNPGQSQIILPLGCNYLKETLGCFPKRAGDVFKTKKKQNTHEQPEKSNLSVLLDSESEKSIITGLYTDLMKQYQDTKQKKLSNKIIVDEMTKMLNDYNTKNHTNITGGGYDYLMGIINGTDESEGIKCTNGNAEQKTRNPWEKNENILDEQFGLSGHEGNKVGPALLQNTQISSREFLINKLLEMLEIAHSEGKLSIDSETPLNIFKKEYPSHYETEITGNYKRSWSEFCRSLKEDNGIVIYTCKNYLGEINRRFCLTIVTVSKRMAYDNKINLEQSENAEFITRSCELVVFEAAQSRRFLRLNELIDEVFGTTENPNLETRSRFQKHIKSGVVQTSDLIRLLNRSKIIHVNKDGDRETGLMPTVFLNY